MIKPCKAVKQIHTFHEIVKCIMNYKLKLRLRNAFENPLYYRFLSTYFIAPVKEINNIFKVLGFLFTLLQNPCMHGVPSGRMSCWSTGKQVSFMLMRQHRLQASATTDKIKENRDKLK